MEEREVVEREVVEKVASATQCRCLHDGSDGWALSFVLRPPSFVFLLPFRVPSTFLFRCFPFLLSVWLFLVSTLAAHWECERRSDRSSLLEISSLRKPEVSFLCFSVLLRGCGCLCVCVCV